MNYYDINGNPLPDASGAAFAIDATGNTIDLTAGQILGGGGGSGPVSNVVPVQGGGWSNIGTFFGNLSTAFSNIYHTVSGPPVNVYNPRTGQPYTQAQLTTLAQQNAQLGAAGSFSGLLPVALLVLVAVLVFRK